MPPVGSHQPWHAPLTNATGPPRPTLPRRPAEASAGLPGLRVGRERQLPEAQPQRPAGPRIESARR